MQAIFSLLAMALLALTTSDVSADSDSGWDTIGFVPAYSSVSYEVDCDGEELAVVSLDGTDSLDLSVIDEDGNSVGNDDDGSRPATVFWVPGAGGHYTITVQNNSSEDHIFGLTAE